MRDSSAGGRKRALRGSLAVLMVTFGLSSSTAARVSPPGPALPAATPVTDRWFVEEACAFAGGRGDCSAIESLCAACPAPRADARPPGPFAQRIAPSGDGCITEGRRPGAAFGNESRPDERRQAPERKHYLRAALEITTWIAIYGGNYYTGDRSVNHVDWEYDVGSSLRARFVNGDAYRFDDNSFRINRNHTSAGMYYYQFARSNNLGIVESFLYTLAASSLWEYGVEYRELVSINDQILTPFAGLALGEATHQVARMLARGPRTFPDAVLADLLDIPAAFNRWVDGEPVGGWRESRPAPTWRTPEHLDFGITFRSASGGPQWEPPPARFRVEAGVLTIPGYAEPGVERRLLTDTVRSRLTIEIPLNFAPITHSGFEAENTLAALHWKDLARTDDGELQGYTLFIGPSNAFTLFNGPTPGSDAYDDYMAVVNLLGPAFDVSWYRRGTRMRAAAALYGDFAMVHPFAFAGYRAIVEAPQSGSLLDVKDYYFALGYSGTARLSVDRGPFEAGLGLSHGSYRSINGRARYAEWDAADIDARDSRRVAEAWLAARLGDRFALRVAVERTVRDGSIEGFSPPAATGTGVAVTVSYSLR